MTHISIDEMSKKVSPARLALLAASAHSLSESYNRHPEVDQGGQYVWSEPENELYHLLRKELGLDK